MIDIGQVKQWAGIKPDPAKVATAKARNWPVNYNKSLIISSLMTFGADFPANTNTFLPLR